MRITDGLRTEELTLGVQVFGVVLKHGGGLWGEGEVVELEGVF